MEYRNEYERLSDCLSVIKGRTDFVPYVGVVLGSGLGAYADRMDVVCEIPYSQIPGFPLSTVAGHEGKYIFGYVGASDTCEGVPIVAMQGRIHYYEGYDIRDVVLPVRLMGMMGAKVILLTNAAGGINLDFRPGDLMLITDHISSFVPSPLIGPNIDELGTRFPDMSHVYSPELMDIMRTAAKENAIELKEGVYCQASGPQFETPAEIRMFRTMGASAAGMSTAVEAIAANHMGIRVAGVSCITNMAAGILDQPLTHEEVQATADRVAENFEKLITGFIRDLGKKEK